MTQSRRPFIGGNWKMNTLRDTADALAIAVQTKCSGHAQNIDIAIFPPFPYLNSIAKIVGDGPLLLGSQDVYYESEGAFTGEVSSGMLADVGCSVVMIGHSERRHVLGEGNELVNLKTVAALNEPLWVVLCIGETLEQREAGETDAINVQQLRAGLQNVPADQAARQIVIAYEPVWAIGTGMTATPQDAQSAHEAIRSELAAIYDEATAAAIRIIYGGSVKPANASELFAMADIDGFLVGGASLEAESFEQIVSAATSG